MRIINIFKLGLGVVALCFTFSCRLAPEVEAQTERDVKVTSNLREKSKTPSKQTPEDVIRVKDDIWMGDKSIVEYEGEPIPTYLEGKDGITLISNRPITLFEIGDMINKVTSLQVRYAPSFEEATLAAAAENAPTAENINLGWADPNRMILSYKGPLSGLLDEVASRFGLWWKYEHNEIYFYRYITKTFVLYSLPTKQSLNVSVGGKSADAGSTGDSGTGLTSTADLQMWENIEKSVTSMIDEKAKLSIDSTNGTISLTATPNDIKKVAKFVNEQNQRLSKQVAISVKVFQVTLKDSDQYGLDLSVIAEGSRIGTNVLSPTNALSDDVAKNLTMTILSGDFINSEASIQALSKQGSTSLVTSGTVTTLNNKPAPIQVIRKQKYIKEITRTNSSGDSGFVDFSVETDDIETGFTMNVLPRILEHNRVMMLFNLTLSDLVDLETVNFGNKEEGQYIQNPIIESRGFTQEVTMKSGETLILTGYERTQNELSKTGTGTPGNMLLGGSIEATKDRTVLVIILTPVVLESPLTPESRMNNI